LIFRVGFFGSKGASSASLRDVTQNSFNKGIAMISLEFLITSLVVVLAPGTGVVYTVSTGIVQGRKASIFAALGCTAGIIPHLLATVLGLAAVMHTSALAFSVLKYAGVAYLFYVAYATFKDRSAFAVDSSVSKTSARTLVTRAFLMNILNPKLTIFFLAFLPQFVNPVQYEPMTHLLVLSAVFMGLTFVVFVFYGFLAHAFRRLVIESASAQKLLRYGFSAAFAGLGAKLALVEK
jgi:threonine/homoserine/homoserine lactone efflux protein